LLVSTFTSTTNPNKEKYKRGPNKKANNAIYSLFPIYVAYQVIKQDELRRKSIRVPILLLANDLRASRIRVKWVRGL
jgi:hypothetical protein